MIGGMKLAPLLATAAVVTGGSDEIKMGADKILDALEKKYQAEISHADATIKIYFNNPFIKIEQVIIINIG